MQPARRVLASPSPGATFTCHGCLARRTTGNPHQRRAFSRSAPRHAPPAGPPAAGLAELSSRKLISISGPDAAKYLQGVITANLYTSPSHQQLRSDAGFYAAFLTAQGRVLHDVFVYRDTRPGTASSSPGDSWLLDVDATEAERLQKHIKRYKLRAKFDVRLLDQDEGRVWAAFAHRILTFSPSSAAPPPTSSPLPPQVSEEYYRLRRYLHGVPEGQAEILRDAALPHESNVDLMGGVDFRKGCYVGQELTIRTEHRGVVRKRILPCLLYPAEEEGGGGAAAEPDRLEYKPELGNGVTAEMVPAEASIGRVGKKGRSAGKWLAGVGNLGLALCRLEIMTGVVLPGETGGTGYSPGDEFVVGVKIKAFVPEWVRKGLADKEAH
ncbi:hypothetical protein NEMBOFW57_000363 [Staphylotrichum longicolle]|uniref:Iron-sulfur cluster assembly factor IBA57 homolog, mitochondrial n=1 Tax=Staphylotrichum longicolle TaxID=669026 RepID=A0AAD4F3Y9_9PEZI|nr:hypothetical protein NEMBOFW57_000363 [Staphylotrichum longicolle]